MQSFSSSSHNPGQKPKLLVVDDEPDNLDLLYRTFYREFKVLRASSGYEALSLLENQADVAVIISDQRMPGMSGTVFLRETATRYPNIIRIILTGYTDVEDLVHAINEGQVFKYVTKPWDEGHLRAVVAQALETHRVLVARTAELQHSLQQESLLNTMTHAICSVTGSRSMMQAIADTVSQLMGTDLCVLKPMAAATTLGATAYTASSEAVCTDALSPWEADLAWNVTEVTQLTPASLASQTGWERNIAAFEALDIQSSLLLPMVVQRQLIAVLALHHCGQAYDWHSSQIKLLSNMTNQAALALSQALTYERAQALAHREQLLNTVMQAIRSSLESQKIFAAITRELGQALSADSCVLSLWTAQDTVMQCVGLYTGANNPTSVESNEPGQVLPKSQIPIQRNPVLQEILHTREPLALNDLHYHPAMAMQDTPLRLETRSLLVVPLLIDGQIIGSISLRHIHRPHIWTPDEIALAQAVANQAAIAVHQSRLYQTTRKQAEQLLALDRQKTEFFQNISHEFRTPLTLILGPLEAAVSQVRGLSHEQSSVALRNTQRLLRLVNQLLDLQRLDAGHMQPTFRPVDLATFVGEIIQAFRPYCDRKGLQLETRLEAGPTVYVDSEKFDKILYNLLSNAVKFTPEGGTITVALTPSSTQCELVVQDTGIGIQAEQIPHLFQRFHQSEGSVHRRYEGTGLGLALVKELVSLHQGNIHLDSTYGVGTAVTVTLPTGHSHLPSAQLTQEPARPVLHRAAVELADTWSGAPTGRSPRTETVSKENSAAHILVVDDNIDLRTYIAQTLQDQGYQVQTASGGAVALEAMKQTTPDLLLTDLMMPEMSGIELIEQVRQDDRWQSLPIILLTAKVDDETRIQGVEQGADGYLGKPFNDRELLAEVRNLLALKANERKVVELNQYLTESVLRRFLPAALVTKAAVGELQLDLQPEPRLITVLFSDIVGYTALSNRLGPQRIALLLNQYLTTITDAIFASGGTVDKFMGDGVLALFGAPEELPPVQQAQQALDAVDRMRQALAELNQQWQQQGMEPILVRYGIHQGEAVVGLFGSEVRSDYTAIGPCVNIASRLQEAATPGTVLASWEFARHFSREAIVCTRSVNLRGLTGPMLAYTLRPSQRDYSALSCRHQQ